MCRTKRCVICAANRAAISSLAPRSGERVASAEGASRVGGILCADLSGRRRRLSRVAILEFGRLEERGGRSRGDPCEVARAERFEFDAGLPLTRPSLRSGHPLPATRGEGIPHARRDSLQAHIERSTVSEEPPTHTVLQPEGWPRPRGFAYGIRARGDMVFVGGMIGQDERGRLAEGFVAQTKQALANIAAVLAQAGASPQHIVRLTWYV